MTEQIYRFDGLPIHEAIVVQNAIVRRKQTLNTPDADKSSKAAIAELDLMYDDLDRHIARETKEMEARQKPKGLLAQD